MNRYKHTGGGMVETEVGCWVLAQDAMAEIDRLRSIISACHEALGEDAASDDDTLAEGVRLMREAAERLGKERDEALAKIAQVLDLTTARADAHVVLSLIEKALTDGKESK